MKYDAKKLSVMANSVRALALQGVLSANSGHLGVLLGAADIVTVLFANHLKSGTDKFVLSAGHASALLYSVLKLSGYNIPDIKTFRQMDGLPGHPEFGIDGVFATTGPLGQGIANAVGLALAEKIRKTNGKIYCLCSDGDLMEGIAHEAIAFAGRNKLDNLILLWDDNQISIDGSALTDINISERMLAAGWYVQNCQNANDVAELDKKMSVTADAPMFIDCHTVIGYGSSLANNANAHGFALQISEIETLISQYASDTGCALWQEIANRHKSYHTEYVYLDLSKVSVPEVSSSQISSRELSGQYLAEIMKTGAFIIGGSADLSSSTNVKTPFNTDIDFNNGYMGNFINYGVREHSMAGIMNGMCADGLRVYASTFLVFSDYMRPAIRLSALSGLPVVYVFSHDSVAVGQDGPTHQPVEQIASLRLIPNINVFRPCNMMEVAVCWNIALTEKKRPSCIILSRQKYEQIASPEHANINAGGYIIYPAKSKRVKITLLATGSEVPLAINVAKRLGNFVQVVSVPSVERFRSQTLKYKKTLLCGYVIAIEAGASAGWFEFADAVVGIDKFGQSGDGVEVYKKYGFDVDKIVCDIKNKFSNAKS